jgi:hypothetical protein
MLFYPIAGSQPGRRRRHESTRLTTTGAARRLHISGRGRALLAEMVRSHDTPKRAGHVVYSRSAGRSRRAGTWPRLPRLAQPSVARC